MKQMSIIETNPIWAEDDHYVEHEEEVNNLLKALQTECACEILNVNTIITKNNAFVTTIYFDDQPK